MAAAAMKSVNREQLRGSGGVEQQLVAFHCASELYGVAIADIQEIIRLQTITPLPRSKSDMAGIINLRGKIIPVLSLRRRLNLPEAEATRASRIMVVTHHNETGETAQESANGDLVGLIVDDVLGVLRLTPEQIEPSAQLAGGLEQEAIQGVGHIGERLIVLLDMARVLQDNAPPLLSDEAA